VLDLVEDGLKQRLLAREVVSQCAARNARACGDVANADRVISPLGEELSCGNQQFVARSAR
jgi:hypothetical protein